MLRRAVLSVAGGAIRLAERRRGPGSAPALPRVLLIRPDHLGDIVMSSPSVELLRKALPEAHIAMMVGPWGTEIARRDPMLNEILLCPFPGFTRTPRESALAPYRLLRRTASEVKRGGFDAAVVLRFDHWWGAWLAALAGIPVRVGHGVRECAPFLTHIADPPGSGHWVEQSRRAVGLLLRAWGISVESLPERLGLRFGLDADDEREAARISDSLGLDPHRPVVAFHPGSGSPLKLWPEERWIGLGWILAGRGAQIVVTGADSEADTAERIARSIPGGASTAGRTSLGSLAALFRRCALVVGTDSGPLHLAVAAGTPTVHLFGPTDPAVFGPWGEGGRHRVVASKWTGAPCGQLDLQTLDGKPPRCMKAISIDQVARACLELLSAEC